jgi:hypothetical protein
MLYLGLDLGQAADYSALAVIEEPIYCPPMGGWVSGAELTPEYRAVYRTAWYEWGQQAPGKPPLWLRALHRYPLRTPYPDIVADVVRRLGGAGTQRNDAVLVVDGTGVGAAVVDMFRYADPPLPCELRRVVIHGGVKVTIDRGIHVPKRDLIGAVQVVLHTGRLQVARHSEATEVWAREMQNYQLKLSDSGHDIYNARGDSQHDDLVLAVALAVWLREYQNRGQ